MATQLDNRQFADRAIELAVERSGIPDAEVGELTTVSDVVDDSNDALELLLEWQQEFGMDAPIDVCPQKGEAAADSRPALPEQACESTKSVMSMTLIELAALIEAQGGKV